MSDSLHLPEAFVSVTEAISLLPTVSGRSLSSLTVRRWMTKGVRGVRLKSYRIGNRMVTTRVDLERFLVETGSNGVKVGAE